MDSKRGHLGWTSKAANGAKCNSSGQRRLQNCHNSAENAKIPRLATRTCSIPLQGAAKDEDDEFFRKIRVEDVLQGPSS